MEMPRPDSVSSLASCQQEQLWNQRQLEQTAIDPAWQLWAYQTPGLVLGCSQKNAISTDPARKPAGIEVVSRQAGGGAVLVGPWMLSTSVVLPNAHTFVSGNLVASYRWLGELYASLLQDLGVAAHAITPEEARVLQQTVPAELAWACYGGFSPWEVVVGKRKIVGLAQVRRRTGVLLVAGLLLDRPDWPLLVRAMDKPTPHAALLENGTTSCAEQVGRDISLSEIAHPLAHAVRNAVEHPGNTQLHSPLKKRAQSC
ncbi:MAG: lipoate--protein ligase family protein [Burkholderiaceae bacterium]